MDTFLVLNEFSNVELSRLHQEAQASANTGDLGYAM